MNKRNVLKPTIIMVIIMIMYDENIYEIKKEKENGHLPLAPTISCDAYPSLVSTARIISAYGMVDGRIA